MKNLFFTLLFLSLFFISSMVFISCTKSDTKEKSTIEKINEKNADAAKAYVNDPLDKAKEVQADSEQRVKEMEDTIDTE